MKGDAQRIVACDVMDQTVTGWMALVLGREAAEQAISDHEDADIISIDVAGFDAWWTR